MFSLSFAPSTAVPLRVRGAFETQQEAAEAASGAAAAATAVAGGRGHGGAAAGRLIRTRGLPRVPRNRR